MPMIIGLAGKPNAGKSTFFKSSTLADVDIASYPFTTIRANHGVAYVQTACPCSEREERCGKCADGIRYVPIDIIDVAGLVPDAHKGKGLGNAFLDDLRQAQAIIHVIDASGSMDAEGNPVMPGTRDPLDDIRFLNKEIEMWLFDILNKNWSKLIRKAKAEGLRVDMAIAAQLMGAGVSEDNVSDAVRTSGLDMDEPQKWTEEDLLALCRQLKKESKPMIIAANKCDLAAAGNIENLKKLEEPVVFVCAAAELALRTASGNGIVRYTPGEDHFEVLKDQDPVRQKALDSMAALMKKMNGTGVQECINKAVFDLLDMIIVYPVEDEGKWADKRGSVLPDAYLVKKGTTCRDLAYRIHTDIGNGFLYGVDARTKRRVSEKHELENGDVIKIVSTAK